jgi:hypothetical protein
MFKIFGFKGISTALIVTLLIFQLKAKSQKPKAKSQKPAANSYF